MVDGRLSLVGRLQMRGLAVMEAVAVAYVVNLQTS
jgi:hypothetical protein